jgi:DEAD/DEAH box helicase domain-containing protein
MALEPETIRDWRRDELDLALVGAGRAMQTVASILLMSDPRDLGLVSQSAPHAERPVIYLYDGVPAGWASPVDSSSAMRAHPRARDLVTACACLTGCPACTGPSLGRGDARGSRHLLTMLGGETQAPRSGDRDIRETRRSDRRGPDMALAEPRPTGSPTDDEVVALDVG